MASWQLRSLNADYHRNWFRDRFMRRFLGPIAACRSYFPLITALLATARTIKQRNKAKQIEKTANADLCTPLDTRLFFRSQESAAGRFSKADNHSSVIV